MLKRAQSLARAVIKWPRSWTHLSKSAIFGNFSTKKTRPSDGLQQSMPHRPEPMLWVEDGRHVGMQARCLDREFKISYGSRNLVLSNFVMISYVEYRQE